MPSPLPERRAPAAQDDQAFLYDLSHAAAALAMTDTALAYAEHGEDEQRLATIFIGRAIADLGSTLWRSGDRWGQGIEALAPAQDFVAKATHPDLVVQAASAPGDQHLRDDLGLVADTFRRFGEEKIAPHAEHIHRNDADIPDEIIQGVAELGCFGLSIAESYGGFASGTEDDYMAMVIATEELSRASLGAGGSLITRPEILARALESGGTEAQKQHWLPRIAQGETLCAVAVTEPDHGSDVANLKVSATETDDGYLLNGTKTWCTFAGKATALMVLARTNPDPDCVASRPQHSDRRKAPRRRSLVPPRGRRRHHGGARNPHPRLPRDAQLRGELRRLVRACGESDRRIRRRRPGLLPANGRVRERQGPNRSSCGGDHAACL